MFRNSIEVHLDRELGIAQIEFALTRAAEKLGYSSKVRILSSPHYYQRRGILPEPDSRKTVISTRTSRIGCVNLKITSDKTEHFRFKPGYLIRDKTINRYLDQVCLEIEDLRDESWRRAM